MMQKRNVILTIVTLTALLLALPLQAQQQPASNQVSPKPAQPESRTFPKTEIAESVAELEENSRQAYADGKYVRYYVANMKLHELRPYEPSYMENIVAACALVNRPKTAFHYLLKMQRQGLAMDLSKNPDTESIRHNEVWTYLNDLMIEAGVASGEGEVVFTLPAEFSRPVAISWDESRGQFLVGTESNGAVVAVSQDGSTQVLIKANDENGLWAIRGLHADSKNNRLWVSSAAVPAFSAYHATDKGRGALFEFDLKTLELKGRFNLPVDGQYHDLGPMAVAPDHGKLYGADSDMGILVVDPVQQRHTMLTGPEDLNLGAISGLFYSQGKLLMLQNNIQPQRIMGLELDASGTKIVSVTPVAIALEEFDRPAFGTIMGDDVYYFANPGENQAVKVLKTPVNPGDSIESAEMRNIRQKAKAAQ